MMIGMMLGNRYEVLEQLGGGGMAVVYKGRDTFLNRHVTIKVLRQEYISDEDFVQRFRREAQSVASLSHPNIVSIYDVGRENDTHYLVMEYVEGENLKTIIRQEGALEIGKAIDIARQICEALEHAHENRIVHRDVKPQNILITKTGRAKLTDFGIARTADGATITSSDTVLGSVHYLSPEQARGEVADDKSDIYSLGAVLYEMLSGVVPYSGDSPIAIAIKHIQEEIDPISKYRPGVPQSLETLVKRAMQKRPENRFATVGDFSRHLAGVLSGTGQGLLPVKEDDTVVLNKDDINTIKDKGRRRRLSPAGWVALAVLLGLLLGGGFFALNNYFNVPEVKVPSVVGLKLEDAQKALSDKGLSSTKREEYSDTVKEGYVSAQDPGPDSPMVKEGRAVILTVSLGQDLKTVPDLYRQSLVNARIKLTEAGFELVEPAQEGYDDLVPQGEIYLQEPRANTKQPRGTKINVYVSKGVNPGDRLVPNLVGLSQEQARAELIELKIPLDPDVTWENSSELFSGQVKAQSPASDTPVTEDTTVKLVLSNGPGPPVREATVQIRSIPADGQNHEVKISVTDARGTSIAYINTHQAGDQVVKTVKYWGKATIKVFIDNKQVESQDL